VSTFPSDLFKELYKGPDPFFVPSTYSGFGHRHYVGADAGSGLDFHEAAKFQLDFLQRQGLCRDTTFLDIGCGCLRGGIHFISFLAPGRYLGMDISAEVVRHGITAELGLPRFLEKQPEFVISDQFDIGAFSKSPTLALANSVFTHLGPTDIRTCLSHLPSPVTFFASFNEGERPVTQSGFNHYLGGNDPITYTQNEMHAFGHEFGFDTEYVGDWGHPKNSWRGEFRNQMMFRFSRK
jgi:hypothetical protein